MNRGRRGLEAKEEAEEDITNDELERWLDLSLPTAQKTAQLMQEFRAHYDADTYINTHWDAAAASPAAEYRRLHEQVRVKQAAMESGREAYDVLMRKLKALKEMVDAAIGEV